MTWKALSVKLIWKIIKFPYQVLEFELKSLFYKKMRWKTTPSRSCECIGLNGFGPQKRARGPLPARGALLWPPLLLSKIQLEKRELKPNTMWNKGLLFSELGLDDFITSTCQRSTWGHGRRAETNRIAQRKRTFGCEVAHLSAFWLIFHESDQHRRSSRRCQWRLTAKWSSKCWYILTRE